MAGKLPPVPVGVPSTHSFWNDWYEKMRQIVNEIASGFTWASITGTPTTRDGYGITDVPKLDGVNRINVGVDTTDFITIDDNTKGIVLKSPNGHYWQSGISNAGVVTWTDLGTTKP